MVKRHFVTYTTEFSPGIIICTIVSIFKFLNTEKIIFSSKFPRENFFKNCSRNSATTFQPANNSIPSKNKPTTSASNKINDEQASPQFYTKTTQNAQSPSSADTHPRKNPSAHTTAHRTRDEQPAGNRRGAQSARNYGPLIPGRQKLYASTMSRTRVSLKSSRSCAQLLANRAVISSGSHVGASSRCRPRVIYIGRAA